MLCPLPNATITERMEFIRLVLIEEMSEDEATKQLQGARRKYDAKRKMVRKGKRWVYQTEKKPKKAPKPKKEKKGKVVPGTEFGPTGRGKPVGWFDSRAKAK